MRFTIKLKPALAFELDRVAAPQAGIVVDGPNRFQVFAARRDPDGGADAAAIHPAA